MGDLVYPGDPLKKPTRLAQDELKLKSCIIARPVLSSIKNYDR